MDYLVIAENVMINGTEYYAGDVVNESQFKQVQPISKKQEDIYTEQGIPLEVSEVQRLLESGQIE